MHLCIVQIRSLWVWIHYLLCSQYFFPQCLRPKNGQCYWIPNSPFHDQILLHQLILHPLHTECFQQWLLSHHNLYAMNTDLYRSSIHIIDNQIQVAVIEQQWNFHCILNYFLLLSCAGKIFNFYLNRYIITIWTWSVQALMKYS